MPLQTANKGLGIFQALIGYDSIRLVTQGQDTLLSLGTLSTEVWLALGGVLLIVLLLMAQVKAAMLGGIVAVAAVAWIGGWNPAPTQVVAWPALQVCSCDVLLFVCECLWICQK
jgi:xanthine/uracil/vitamin C permease (AzgA family)